MGRIIITIKFDTERMTGEKRLNVRNTITAGDLITETQKQFSLDGLYELKLGEQTLNPNLPLDEQGVADQTLLTFAAVLVRSSDTAEMVARGQSRPFSVKKRRVFLREEREGSEYDLTWMPAIIGRRDPRDLARNRLLAVDLDDVSDGKSVSRHHACIVEENGSFFIESLNERNPTFLNDVPLRFGFRSLLRTGDRVLAGRVSMMFHIMD